MVVPERSAAFIEPMECLAVSKLPKSSEWLWEIKLDGYRAEAVKSDGNLFLLSRRQKSFSKQFPLIRDGLADLPDNTVMDGEIVALDESGRPDFNLLQNFRSGAKSINYFVFDLLALKGQDLTSLPLIERRNRMRSLRFSLPLIERRNRMRSLRFSSPLIRICEQFETSTEDMLAAVRQLGLEGVIGKRKDSKYEIGKRTGSWIKYRINRGQELVIGGYFPGPHGFDSIILGYYKGEDLIYVARTRAGFVPASRRQVFSRLKHLVTPTCPFANLPETKKSRFGEELNAEKMKKAVWLDPEVVAQIEFLEWTEGDRLRHSKFVGLREDKDAKKVVKEQAGKG
jgi:DNA ligase D-like protein (predicted ligase)